MKDLRQIGSVKRDLDGASAKTLDDTRWPGVQRLAHSWIGRFII
jgi:hypothetical protein